MDGLAQLRTPLAHNRGDLLTETDRLQVLVYSEYVIKCAAAYGAAAAAAAENAQGAGSEVPGKSAPVVGTTSA